MTLSGHKPTRLTIELSRRVPLKPDEEQTMHEYHMGDQDGLSCSSSLAVLADATDADFTPISPLSISPSPSPSALVDDEMSDVSVLSPYTPFTGLSPITTTSNQTPIRDYESPTSRSPLNSTLALDPFAQSPGAPVRGPATALDSVSPPSKLGFRAKAKGLEFKLPNFPISQYHVGHGLRSPVDTIRQQDVFPLPSPIARDLRRRVEHESEGAEMDIAVSYDEDSYGFNLPSAPHSASKRGSSCLELDLGVLVTPTEEEYFDRESYVVVGAGPGDKNDAIGDERDPGADDFSAKIMQASLARSASAELVSSPERSQMRRVSPVTQPKTIKETAPKSPSKIYPRKTIPLPKFHLQPSFTPADEGEVNRTAYTLGSLPISSAPPTPEGPVVKHDSPRQGSRVHASLSRFLDAAPLSLAARRKPVHQDSYAAELERLRMHGYAQFPNRFPEGHLLEPKFAQQYYVETELGSGGYGFVLGARNMFTGEQVAVKFIERRLIPNRGLVRDYKNEVVPLEAVVLQLAEHPGVVRFYGLYQDDLYFYLVQELHGSPWSKNAKNQHKSDQENDTPGVEPKKPQADVVRSKPLSPHSPYTPVQSSPLRPLASSVSLPIVPTLGQMSLQREAEPPVPHPSLPLLARPQMPRRASYDLFECIEQHECLSEKQARYIFAQVVDTVRYLDSIGISHRDIKDENLVIDKDFKVKLIDFGSAVIRDVRKLPPTYTRFYGTVTFASPEILQNLAYTAPPAEVWTLGILLSFLVTGQSPFPTPDHTIHAVMCEPPEKIVVSPACGDLMRKCLHPDPASRLTIQQVRDHPWLHGALDRA